MLTFWRKEPLNDKEIALFKAMTKAHVVCTFRDNPSSVLVKVVAESAGDYPKALIAALSSLGGKHAPIEAIGGVLSDENPVALAAAFLATGDKVPGWGSSFVKEQYDPDWLEVHSILQDHFPKLLKTIHSVTDYLHSRGKKVYPNPGCYTAATAIALALPPKLAPWLFVQARLTAWAQLFAEHCG